MVDSIGYMNILVKRKSRYVFAVCVCVHCVCGCECEEGGGSTSHNPNGQQQEETCACKNGIASVGLLLLQLHKDLSR